MEKKERRWRKLWRKIWLGSSKKEAGRCIWDLEKEG